MNLPEVIAITDPRWSDEDLARKAEEMLGAVPAGSVAVQMRDKVRPGRFIFALGERLRAICARYQAPFYVSDRVDVALALAADGVHLGGASIDVGDARALLGPAAFISMAAHVLDDVARARASGATAVLASPIYATPGKGPPQGTRFLERAGEEGASGVRVYALGGIDVNNAVECRRAGARGVAVMRAIWDCSAPSSVARSLVEAVRLE